MLYPSEEFNLGEEMKKTLGFIIIAVCITTIFGECSAASKIPELTCFGTEPFWSINADSRSLIYENLGDEKLRIFSDVKIKNSLGSAENYAFQVTAEDEDNDILKLNVLKVSCNDGMSDETYTYTSMVEVEGELLTGCCN